MGDYRINTETVRDVFVGTGGDESYRVFNEWLSSIWSEAFEQGMAKEGAGGGDIEPCPYI